MKKLIVVVLGLFIAGISRASELSHDVDKSYAQAAELERKLERALRAPAWVPSADGAADSSEVFRALSYQERAVFPDEVEDVTIEASFPIGSIGQAFEVPTFEEKSLENMQYEVSQANL